MFEAAGDHAKGVIGPGVLKEKAGYKPLMHWIRLFWMNPDSPGPYDIGRLSFDAVSQNCLPAGGALIQTGVFRSGTKYAGFAIGSPFSLNRAKVSSHRVVPAASCHSF
ncbi:hypothetical protein [Desulfatirhabdium butyrativorans]|uniref:hypothetical protein n=1 Tax=Desulfatirhabdium butyrativorans TaxID=340467 RepID=UPI000486D38E|nr:hypothetical protein [Desulfatirhabdium butyrativorans]